MSCCLRRQESGDREDPADRTGTRTGSHRVPAAETLHPAVSLISEKQNLKSSTKCPEKKRDGTRILQEIHNTHMKVFKKLKGLY